MNIVPFRSKKNLFSYSWSYYQKRNVDQTLFNLMSHWQQKQEVVFKYVFHTWHEGRSCFNEKYALLKLFCNLAPHIIATWFLSINWRRFVHGQLALFLFLPLRLIKVSVVEIERFCFPLNFFTQVFSPTQDTKIWGHFWYMYFHAVAWRRLGL